MPCPTETRWEIELWPKPGSRTNSWRSSNVFRTSAGLHTLPQPVPLQSSLPTGGHRCLRSVEHPRSLATRQPLRGSPAGDRLGMGMRTTPGKARETEALDLRWGVGRPSDFRFQDSPTLFLPGLGRAGGPLLKRDFAGRMASSWAPVDRARRTGLPGRAGLHRHRRASPNTRLPMPVAGW